MTSNIIFFTFEKVVLNQWGEHKIWLKEGLFVYHIPLCKDLLFCSLEQYYYHKNIKTQTLISIYFFFTDTSTFITTNEGILEIWCLQLSISRLKTQSSDTISFSIPSWLYFRRIPQCSQKHCSTPCPSQRWHPPRAVFCPPDIPKGFWLNGWHF